MAPVCSANPTECLNVLLPAQADTLALGAALGPLLRAGDTLALRGDLGAGKTTLVRGLIGALCGPETEVPSPTYTLVQTYEIPGGPALYHLDLYRLKAPEEVIELGWEDMEAGVRLVEWPERAGRYWPDNTLEIALTPWDCAGMQGRRAGLCGARKAWQDRLKELALTLRGCGLQDGDSPA